MTDWILQGWGDKELWTLNNSTWVIYFEEDCLQTGDEVSGGYGEKEFNNIANRNWEFNIGWYTLILPGVFPIANDVCIFLENDPNPILFRFSYSADHITIYIIYNDIIQAQKTLEYGGPDFESFIRRSENIYYFIDSNLMFDYGSQKTPVKLKLSTGLNAKRIRWFDLKWWYTEVAEESYAFIM